jgi:hypothetical protein
MSFDANKQPGRLVAGLFWALAGFLVAGCSSDSAEDLAIRMQSLGAARNEAERTGQPTVELAARQAEVKAKLMRLADDGDPVACINAAALHFGAAQAAFEARSSDPSWKADAKRWLRDTVNYSGCALKKPDALNDSERNAASKWTAEVPELIKVIERE